MRRLSVTVIDRGGYRWLLMADNFSPMPYDMGAAAPLTVADVVGVVGAAVIIDHDTFQWEAPDPGYAPRPPRTSAIWAAGVLVGITIGIVLARMFL